jgi:glycosyltransferase involved in cell wall biosynthesis
LKTLIFVRRMPHYREVFFEKLRKLALSEGIEVDVMYGQPRSDEISKKDVGTCSFAIETKIQYLPKARIGKIHGGFPDNYDLIILPHEAMILDITTQIMFRKKSRTIAFWGHGRNFQAENKSSFSEIYKSYLAKKADYWFSYNRLSTEALKNQNIQSQNIFEVGNTIDLPRFKIKQGFKESGIFVGSLYKHKRIKFLLQAVAKITEQVPNFKFTVIGDGPDSGLVQQFANKYENVSYLGVITDPKRKMSAYQMAGITICPGLVGLNIVESIKSYTPLITTTFDKHSPEIDYLNSNNGLMTKNTLDDFVEGCIWSIANQNKFFADQKLLRSQLEYLDIDNMVSRFLNGLVTIKNEKYSV